MLVKLNGMSNESYTDGEVHNCLTDIFFEVLYLFLEARFELTNSLKNYVLMGATKELFCPDLVVDLFRSNAS